LIQQLQVVFLYLKESYKVRKGVTLVEVVVSSLILAIAFGGLLSTFVAVRKYITRANKRLIASDLVSQTLNDLYRAVRSDEWDVGAPGGDHILYKLLRQEESIIILSMVITIMAIAIQ